MRLHGSDVDKVRASLDRQADRPLHRWSDSVPNLQQLMRIVEDAVSLPPAERSAFVKEQCGQDDSLLRAAKEILAASERASESLESPSLASTIDAPGEPANRTLGAERSGVSRFRILKPHARGGLGEVYLAEDGELRREVALKEIQPQHADSPAARSRFMFEAEVTGGLEHPGVVPVYGLGTYKDGRPYYAMRFVKGDDLRAAIKRFHESGDADFHSVAFRSLLRRFLDVCNAIGYAHSRGVLHRDLKPGNIMLGPFGETLVVDWGLAKVVGRKDDDAVLQPSSGDSKGETLPGSAIGTPGYMSPEQAEGRINELGPATDVYALGAVLHSLLTGNPPVSTEGGILAVLDRVRRGELLDALNAPKALIAISRRAMVLQPSERYQSTADLAADVDRWLADEPVTAMKEPLPARMRRWARKHPGAVAGMSATLFVGIVGLAFGLYFVDAERVRTKTQRDLAQTRLDQVTKGNEILTAVFKDLNIRQVKQGDEPLEAVLATRLVKAAEQIEGEAVGDPLVVAGLQSELGVSLMNLGFAVEAAEVLQKAADSRKARLGADHPDTLSSMNDLAGALLIAGKFDHALPLFEEALVLKKSRMGTTDPATLKSMGNLASALRAAGKLDRAMPLFEETFRLMKAHLGPDHFDTLMSMSILAQAYQFVGKLDRAMPLYEETFGLMRTHLGAGHIDTLTSMSNLAQAFRAAGKLDRALPLYEEVFELMKANLGPSHPLTLTSASNLAEGLFAVGKRDRALPLLEETLKLRQAKLGASHPETLTGMSNLAQAFQSMGKLDRALPLYEATLRLAKEKLGPDHPFTLQSMNNLAAGLNAVGKLDEAIPLYEVTLRLQQAKLSIDHPDTLATMNNLAITLRDADKLVRALPLFEETLRLRKMKLGPDHPSTLNTMRNLGQALRAAGKIDRAPPLYEEILKVVQAKLGPDHPETLSSMNNLAVTYRDAGKLDKSLPVWEQTAGGLEKLGFRGEIASVVVANAVADYEAAKRFGDAERWRRKWIAVVKQRTGSDSPAYGSELAQLGDNLLQQGKYTDAETVLRECLTIRQKTQPDVWTTFNTRSVLGKALMGRKEFAKAGPLLREGYEGMKQRERTIPSPTKDQRLGEALDRLVELYTATNKSDEVKKWQAERAKLAPKTPAKGGNEKKLQAPAPTNK
jgi:tetratricopeptide (TPR) repeat protein/tRNA A-37 threonylcarbamoyl transferase component Bud32